MTNTLVALLGNEGAEEAQAVIDSALSLWRLGGDPREAVVELAKMGVATSDLRHAFEATRRVREATGWDLDRCAEFVGATAAIGGITGPSLLLIPNLARIAAR